MQKTAYEMRISDWSSDVCSSDLFFDATAHVEFLYACVQQTIEEDLPREARFLEAFDSFNEAVQQIVDMPTGQVELLLKFLEQNEGRLSQRARSREFERSEEHTSELQSLMRTSYAVFCLKKKNTKSIHTTNSHQEYMTTTK